MGIELFEKALPILDTIEKMVLKPILLVVL